MQNLQIYVAGVHSKTKHSEILHFFESFGPIVSVEPKPCKPDAAFGSELAKQQIPKSYWIVEAGDTETYSKILTVKNCTLFGRSLCLLPFMAGEDLILHSKLKSKKRVLIKKVPSWVTEEQLLAAIESQVEAYFKYETDSHKAKKLDSKKKIRKVCTYSVTMRSRSDRETFVAAGYLRLTPEVSVPVEKYIQRRLHSDSNTFQDKIQNAPTAKISPANTRLPIGLEVQIGYNSRSWNRKSISQSTQIGVSPKLKAPEKFTDSASFIFGVQDSGNSESCQHYLKPTQKRYHCLHRNRVQNLDCERQGELNLRFNAVGGSSAAL
jgi:hypothetical protein